MTKEEILAEILKLDEEIDRLQTSREEKLQEWANLACPLKVEDDIKIVGYSHKGKIGRVDKIYAAQSWRSSYEWRVTVTVLKADGSLSKNRTYFDQNDWESRETDQ